MRKEQYFHSGSSEIMKLIDTAAVRAGFSRGQTFEDYLTCVRCALAGGQMEEEYLATVHKGYRVSMLSETSPEHRTPALVRKRRRGPN